LRLVPTTFVAVSFSRFMQHPARRGSATGTSSQSVIAFVAYPLGIDRRLGTLAVTLPCPWRLRLARAAREVVVSTSLAGRTILVVEDEPLIAMDIVNVFQTAGAMVLTAASLNHAKRLVEQDGLSGAVLDFGLGDEDANALCSRLNERDIPHVLHSGYTHFGNACHRGVVIPKPAPPAALVDALVTLLGRPHQ
jgi:CheY-like chemotaxis protein